MGGCGKGKGDIGDGPSFGRDKTTRAHQQSLLKLASFEVLQLGERMNIRRAPPSGLSKQSSAAAILKVSRKTPPWSTPRSTYTAEEEATVVKFLFRCRIADTIVRGVCLE